jgi:hypothetical protein
VSNDDVKPCPLCGESILAVAIKCKHCGSMLSGDAPAGQVGPQATTTEPDETLGFAMVGIPVFGTLLVWFWVERAPTHPKRERAMTTR